MKLLVLATLSAAIVVVAIASSSSSSSSSSSRSSALKLPTILRRTDYSKLSRSRRSIWEALVQALTGVVSFTIDAIEFLRDNVGDVLNGVVDKLEDLLGTNLDAYRWVHQNLHDVYDDAKVLYSALTGANSWDAAIMELMGDLAQNHTLTSGCNAVCDHGSSTLLGGISNVLDVINACEHLCNGVSSFVADLADLNSVEELAELEAARRRK